MKTCTKCNEEKPLEDFYLRGHNKWKSECKECSKARVNKWVQENRDHHNKYQNNYYHTKKS